MRLRHDGIVTGALRNYGHRPPIDISVKRSGAGALWHE